MSFRSKGGSDLRDAVAMNRRRQKELSAIFYTEIAENALKYVTVTCILWMETGKNDVFPAEQDGNHERYFKKSGQKE